MLMRRHVIIDIETAALPDVAQQLPTFRPRAGTKDEEKQAAQIAEKRERAIMEAATDADLCRVAAVGMWWDGESEPALWLCRDEAEERLALTTFWHDWKCVSRECTQVQMVGFNCLSFDLPILCRRSLYLDLWHPQLERGKYRHRDVIDVLDLLSDDGRLPWRSLSYYLRRFGISTGLQDDIDGAQVPALVAQNTPEAWEQVRQHLLNDLVGTRLLARRVVASLREMAVTA
jgi:hypothetical protein